jgi:uncharacterized metal-binding protein YceD (DUF177 family)
MIDQPNEFPRPLVVADLNRGLAHQVLAMEPGEAQALAARLDIHAVETLSADLKIYRRGARIQVTGTIQATIHQICVVSLEPFRNTITGALDEEFFVTDDPHDIEVVVDETTPEPLTDDVLDLGELVVQNLALLLDPHPRADGAAVEDLEYQPEGASDLDNPFAALRDMKLKR